MVKKERALIVYTHLSTFVKGDITILNNHFRVHQYHFKNSPKGRLPFSFLKQLLFLVTNIYRFQEIYIWFGDYHSFLPTLIARIARKRAYLIAGGYDLCREKRYSYGSFTKPLRAFMTLCSIKWSHKVLCVSNNILRVVKAIAPKADAALLYNGITLMEPNQSLQHEREKREVLCVALVTTLKAFYIKGIDRYSALATALPQYQFTLVGCNSSLFKKANIALPNNLLLIEPVPHNDLIGYYLSHKVYCQLSRCESFSLSLAEAISFGMIPVISKVGGMAEVTGEFGYRVYFGTNGELNLQGVEEAAVKVVEAINQKEGPNGKERIKKLFTLEVRERGLLKIKKQPSLF